MGGNTSMEGGGGMGERFRQMGRVEIYHFGEVERFYDEYTKQEVVRAIYEFMMQADTEDEFMNKLRNSNNNCMCLVNMVKIQTQTGSICSDSGCFHVYFEYLPTTLQSIINQRKSPFPESEVRLLLSSLLQAIRDINERQTYHGDIFPEFIYLDERVRRRYKIFDSAYFNPLKQGYYRAQKEASYSSPEVYANVSEKRSYPLYNYFISDTFSIGLIALYVMTNINPLVAYKTKIKQIDYYYIQMLLRIAAQNMYSEQLLRCVAECIQIKNRPTIAQLLDCYPVFKFMGEKQWSLSHQGSKR